ncbi:hypothetical protein AB0M44_20115 [Streptosporangium subroseum]|uniref:hypothetical protein n=1 Tax=Streptosporangium subroseum TaxID=106412 RepID=UPI003429DE17
MPHDTDTLFQAARNPRAAALARNFPARGEVLETVESPVGEVATNAIVHSDSRKPDGSRGR